MVQKYRKKYNIKGDNNIATQAMRLWLERVRKITKKSIKHWCITELGGNDTERIHIHGVLWGVGLESLIRETWKYGFIFIGQYVTEKTINYITKYIKRYCWNCFTRSKNTHNRLCNFI